MQEEDFIDVVFSKNGLLSHFLEDYEEREGQIAMAEHVFRSYQENATALIEAGTGIGKSFAYVIPALFWALKFKEKTVISTCTIALQEQLLKKDIPFALKVLDADLKVALVKGMGNYLCLRRLAFEREQKTLLGEDDDKELDKIEGWSHRTKEGSFSEINFPVSSSSWDKVKAQRDQCNNTKCPHYKKCFFFKARRKAADAQLIIVNHHLLFADLAMKVQQAGDDEKGAIPTYQRVVLDEAHHVEEIARDSLAIRIDRNTLLHYIHQLDQLLPALKKGLTAEYFGGIAQKVDMDIPSQKRILQQKVVEAFDALDAYLREYLRGDGGELWRIHRDLQENPEWEKVGELFFELAKQLHEIAVLLSNLVEEIEKDLKDCLEDHLQGILIEMRGVNERFTSAEQGIKHYFKELTRKDEVRWVEKRGGSIFLICSHIDISSFLREHFFNRLSTVTLCSATMTTNGNFAYMKERLGIEGKGIVEENYPSPFNYKQNARVLIPTDIPLVSDFGFSDSASDIIMRAVKVSDGGAFVLFTSYKMLKECFDLIVDELEDEGFILFKQGDKPRNQLLEAFKKNERSVLFATNSFWEGVDVPGDNLRLVIITKLPFKVPTDPFVQALSEVLTEQEKNPFFDYLVPEAVIKFKQGFGRLIRKKSDRGCVLCLDKRLVVKQYGKMFLKSLPSSPIGWGTTEEIFDEMNRFMERSGFEPLTSTMPSLRSTN